MNQRSWMISALIAFLTFSGAVFAADVKQEYAVLSLIGDNLTIIQFSTTTGTINRKTLSTLVPVKVPTLDDAALLAVEKAGKQLETTSQFDLLSSSDPVLYKLQNSLFNATDDTATVQSALRNLLKNTTAKHLILITKHRSDAQLQLTDGLIGEGKLEGLGYYIDNITTLTSITTGTTEAGFLAPFAYFKVSLIDAHSLQVVNSQVLTESEIISNAESSQSSLNAWQILSQQQKIELTTTLIDAGIQKAIPHVMKLASPKLREHRNY